MASSKSKSRDIQKPIAVIGMACRLPGNCNTPTDFWNFLLEGGIASTDVPESRFSHVGHYDGSLRPGTMRSPGGMMLSIDPKDIDAGFFALSQVDAISMDPSQRQLLEVVYEGLENAGITLESLKRKAYGCFVGSYASDYSDMQCRDPEDRTPSYTVGSGRAMLSNRISHYLDITGPSMTIDTACSGSLISVDLACRYLDSGDADGAIVAGNNLYMNPEHNMDASAMNSAASPSGRCWTFDARADGYIKAEAINTIILKRLDDAIRDGDPIRAVIRGSSTNSDGWTPGIASPSSDAQAAAIRRAYARAGITNFGDTAYLECHGTGTLAGDPIETKAAASVFSQDRELPLRIGSVKSNIGHSEPAAGISGILKTILALENSIIPGNPTFDIPNPNIDFTALKVLPSKRATAWPQGMLKRASVNSFGYGGSNAHAILEKSTVLAPKYKPPQTSSYLAVQEDIFASDEDEDGLRRVFVFSANDETSIKALSMAFVRHLSNPAVSIKPHDLAYTLSERRTRHFHRGYVVSKGMNIRVNQITYGKLRPSTPVIGFVFTGQGAQHPRMGRELIETFPVAKEMILRLDNTLQAMKKPPTWTLLQELTENRTPEHMRRPEFSQPLVTALQLAILAVLNDWGVRPSMALGHSSGEIAAAAAAGLLTPEEAIKVAYFRGQASLIVPSRNFGMLAAGLGQVDVEAYLLTFPAVKIACINSPKSVTLSGRVDELQLLEASLKNDGHFSRLLQVDLAYHSEYMSGIAAHYLDMVKENCPRLGSSRTSSGVQFFSTVIGAQMANGVDAEYWYCNMICPVQFSEGLECMIEQGGADYLVEVGPSAALAGPIKQCTATLPNRIEYYATLARDEDSVRPLYELAGRMFLSGAAIDLTKVNKSAEGDLPKLIIDLPNYQWNHSVKYWHENLSSQDWRYRKFPIHDLLGSKVLGTAWQNPSFRCILRLKNVPWLRDHKVGSDIIFPAAGYAAMATEAIFQTSKSLGMLPDVDVVSRASYRLRNTRFLRALVLEEDNPQHVYLFLNPSLGPKDTWYHFSIQTLRDGVWTEHCDGLVRMLATVSEQAANADLLRPLEYPTPARVWYKALHNVGFNFGPAFQNLLEIEAIPSKRASRVRSTWSFRGLTGTQSKYAIHPAVIDSFFQAGVPPLYEGYRTGIDRVFVPKIIDDMTILARTQLPETSLTLTECEWTRTGRSDSIRNHASNALVYDENGGDLLFKVAGLRYSELETNAAGHKPHQYVQLAWKPDVTLLSDVGLDSLPLVPSKTDTLEWELDLPGCAVEMLILALHKRPNMSIAEIDLRATEHDIEPQRPSHLSESPIFTRYVHVSNTSQSFNRAQKRLGHLPGTEFCMHDILSSEPLRVESDAKFDMIILKTSTASTTIFATLLDRLRELSTDNGFLMIVQPDDFEDRQGSSSDESLVNISWNFTDTTFILQAAHLPIHLRATDESASRDGALHVIFASSHPSRNDVKPAANTPIVVFSPNVPELIVLRKTLRQLGWTGRVIDPAKAVNLPENMPLVLLDSPTASFLDGITEGDWDTLKALLKPGRQLLYVTSGSQRLVTAPSNALFHGLARTIRGEDPSIKIKTLDVTSLWDWNAAEAIYSAIGTFSNASEDQEMEYCERNGVVSISRLLSDDALIKADESGRHNNELQSKLLHGNPRTVRFRCERIGAMDSLTYYEVSDQPLPLRENCIEIEMHAASLNFKDIATSMGLVPEDEYQLGLEGSGMITRVGRNVKTRHVGQRVLVYSRGSFANRVQAEPQRTLVLPDNMTFEAAATLCSVYFTVLYAFAHVMQLRKGQSVLLHSATGGVGIASIHFCRYIGAEIYATAGSEEKRKYLTDQHGIPPECIFSSRSTGFGSAVMKATHGRGVDVVLNFLTGDLLDESWRCLAPGGVLLEIGKKDIVDRNQLSMEPFNRNCSYRAIDVSHPSIDQDLELTARILGDMMDLLKAGHIQPIAPVKVFSFAKIAEAMRYMRSGAHMGKIVISDGSKDDIEVQTRPATRTLRLDPSGAYLIIGGLKGLCGSLAILLAQAGAKQLVVMSRSGADDHKSRAVIRDITALGAHTIIFKGDVSCAEDVSRMFQQARRPIKGIIHGAMVLRDKTYEAMTSEDFHAVIESKHRGTWNLHEVAQRQASPLEFFTLLSSISGVIGHAGQANYAAGNVFQDAFAAYRQGLGLRCHSVNLGIIEDVGYMSNNQDVAQRAEARGAFTGIDERTLLKIARLSILQQMDTINSQSASQMITGLPVPLPSDSPLLADARFSSLVPAQSTTSGSHAGASTNNTAAAFNQMVKLKTDRSGLLREAVRLVNAQLVKNLGMANDMEPGKSLSTYGIDSLAAVDLRNWLRVQLKAELTTLDILNASSLLILCEKIVSNVLADVEN